MRKYIQIKGLTISQDFMTVAKLLKNHHIALEEYNHNPSSVRILVDYEDDAVIDAFENALKKIDENCYVEQSDVGLVSCQCLNDILNAQSNGIILLNRSGTVLFCNIRAEKILNLSFDKGNDFFQYLDDPQWQLIQSSALNGEVISNEIIAKNEVFGSYNLVISGEPLGENYLLTVYRLTQLKRWLEIVQNVEESELENISGTSYVVENIKKRCVAIANYAMPALISGESGTQKAQYARLIHNLSDRKKAPLIMLDCTVMETGVIERELFGYGANQNVLGNGVIRPAKEGMLRKADGGTLFIHRIQKLSMRVQDKLLAFIQTGCFSRIGEMEQSVASDVRLIFSTDDLKELEAMMEEGRFLKQLYEVLSQCVVEIPPLRERIEDIPSIVYNLIEKYNYILKKHIRGADILYFEELSKYWWPGNDDELSQVVENSMNACAYGQLTHGDLSLLSEEERKTRNFQFDISPLNSEQVPDRLKNVVEREEKRVIEATIEECTDRYRAAKILGISEEALNEKLEYYNLSV